MRNIFALVALSLLATLFLGGCGSSGGHPGTPVGSIRNFQGLLGPLDARGFMVVQRTEVWQELWAGQQPPAVDFNKESVVVSNMGKQSGEGFNISMTDGRLNNGLYTAYIAETRPKSKVLTGAPTTPYSMMVVPKFSSPLSFVLESSKGMAQPAILDEFLGQQSRTAAPDTAVLTDVNGWRTYCDEKLGLTPLPVIDFNINIVVAILLGEKSTAGYATLITGARVKDEKMIITYRVRAPQAGDITAQVITHPYATAVIQRTEMPIVFRDVSRDEWK